MSTWHATVQRMVDEIDRCIGSGEDESLSLARVAENLHYSPYQLSRKFREIAGMQFRDYVRLRRISLSLKALRDTDESILQIALRFGFSSHEAFTRAFKRAFGLTPRAYRKNPVPLALRTLLRPLDCYLMETGEKRMQDTHKEVKTYFITIPAHKFLHIRCYESIGYWDFWQKMSLVPGCDCETVCGLLDSIPHKLDDLGGQEMDSGNGQIMGFINAAEGRICSWGIPLCESYGVRLPQDYCGPVPPQMQLMDVPEGEYLVFEHGPFDFERENGAVEQKIEAAMKAFDYPSSGYELDMTPGRIFYFYHDCSRYWKYVRPVKKV
ncbi:MAG: helix-turn-helix domain-containing protein [Clostridiales bacterium]|nr:helix-turn-helix domain-containing protein [Clostridiales bacterium]